MLILRFQFSLFDFIVYGKNFKSFELYIITAENSNRREYSSYENRIIRAAKVHGVQAHGTDKTKFIYPVTATAATATTTITITIAVTNRSETMYAFLMQQ